MYATIKSLIKEGKTEQVIKICNDKLKHKNQLARDFYNKQKSKNS